MISTITSTFPCFIVTIHCLDCDTIEEIDSVWGSRKDAEARVEILDATTQSARRLANIEETVVISQ